MKTIQHLIAATAAREKLRCIPGVKSIGIGLKERGGEVLNEWGLRVYVKAKKTLNDVPLAERIPDEIDGMKTDVLVVPNFQVCTGTRTTTSGVGITNQKGVPGTAVLARLRHNGQSVVLTNQHVLFGKGGQEDDPVQLTHTHPIYKQQSVTGKTLVGRIGTINFNGRSVFVDCALASCDGLQTEELTKIVGYREGRAGMVVIKTGIGSGTTTGIIVDHDYQELAQLSATRFPTEHQLLIKSTSRQPFSIPGDSGALVLNEAREAVGLLWGTSSNGLSIACPIAPVLYTMNIDLLLFN